MTTFARIQQQSEKFTQMLMDFSGLDREIVENVVQYAKCLPLPDSQEIDENVFTAQMCHQFEMTRSYMISSMFHTLKCERRGGLTLEEYCKCICTFLTTKLDLKIDFAYNVYDVNHDGLLNFLELYTLLKPCILSTPSEEQDIDFEESLKELIDLVITTTDRNDDGVISLEEFRELVKKNVLYIQLLGPTFPTEQMTQRFMNKIRGKSSFQIRQEFENERTRSLNTILRQSDIMTTLYPVKLEIP